jgi:hypothetical protein
METKLVVYDVPLNVFIIGFSPKFSFLSTTGTYLYIISCHTSSVDLLKNFSKNPFYSVRKCIPFPPNVSYKSRLLFTPLNKCPLVYNLFSKVMAVSRVLK